MKYVSNMSIQKSVLDLKALGSYCFWTNFFFKYPFLWTQNRFSWNYASWLSFLKVLYITWIFIFFKSELSTEQACVLAKWKLSGNENERLKRPEGITDGVLPNFPLCLRCSFCRWCQKYCYNIGLQYDKLMLVFEEQNNNNKKMDPNFHANEMLQWFSVT